MLPVSTRSPSSTSTVKQSESNVLARNCYEKDDGDPLSRDRACEHYRTKPYRTGCTEQDSIDGCLGEHAHAVQLTREWESTIARTEN